MGFDEELQTVLENFRQLIQKKLGDLNAAYGERLEEFKSIHRALDDFKGFFEGNQIALIRMELKRGETGKARAGLIQALVQLNRQLDEASGSQLAVARGKRLSAEVYDLGRLAEINFDYFMATHYYKQAASLQPANLTYLQAAVRLAYTACEFHGTEYMLKKILRTQQKLLGPEHPKLAQTLKALESVPYPGEACRSRLLPLWRAWRFARLTKTPGPGYRLSYAQLHFPLEGSRPGLETRTHHGPGEDGLDAGLSALPSTG